MWCTALRLLAALSVAMLLTLLGPGESVAQTARGEWDFPASEAKGTQVSLYIEEQEEGDSSLICSPDPVCYEYDPRGVHIVRIDLDDPRVAVRPGLYWPNGDTNTVHGFVQHFGATAGINGDYFSGGARSWLGATFVDGDDRTVSAEDEWSCKRNLRISRLPHRVGFDFGKNGSADDHWNAIGGGPQFLFGGSFRWDGPHFYWIGSDRKVIINGEHFDAPINKDWFLGNPSHTSAAGGSGALLVLATSAGEISMEDMANVLRDYGATEAIRLDGGGSAQMYYPGVGVDVPGDWRRVANALLVFTDGDSAPCPAPNLCDPGNDHSANDRTITFRWDDVDCDHDGFTFRVKSISNMESGGETVIDAGEGNTQRTVTFDPHWDGRDLYWSVHAANASGGASWAPARRFHISPNSPPSISFDTANSDPFPSGRIESRDRDWTFRGTASDPEGHLDRVEFHWSGDNRGYQASHGDGTNWSHTQNNMSGQNDIYFRAYDDRDQSTSSRHLDLRIDLAAPSTSHNLIGTMGQNGWYVSPVEVRLHAEDGSTGHARVEVREIRYRYDGGGWQTYNGDDISFTVSTNGTHTVEYYAVDNVGNTESSHSVTFKIDATPPTAPGAATEAHGAVSGQWQKDWPDPDFTWGPASDATSGVSHYNVSWSNLAGTWLTTPAYDPPAVPTGEHQLHVYARDSAGNIGPEGPVFTFRYDGTPPHAPGVQNNDGVASGVWQNRVRTANFSWPTPHDEGSGIGGYNVYWGPSATGTSGTLHPENTFANSTPICAADGVATHYLRVRSQDHVGWRSEWVGYALAYDGAPPTAALIANYGRTVVHQTNVHLQIIANDEGSGVKQMRLSNDARTWSEWTDFAEETYWQIPAIGRRFHPIYLQVVDGAGNVSDVVSDSVYLEVNVPRPRSDNFWLWDGMMTAGGGAVTSAHYNLRSSVGQSLDAPQSASANYVLRSGFQAGALAVPTETPTYTTYFQMGYIVAGGGTGATALQSSGYQMYGTLGQPAHIRTITSTNYILLSGFWGGAGTDSEPPEPPEPEPPAPPECEFYSVTINNGAPFTNRLEVALDLCGPDPVEMMLSNDDGFSSAIWQPYARAVPWTLEVEGASVQSRFVYVRFRDSEGEIHGTFFDEIIYDPNAPEGEVAFDLADLLPTTRMQGVARSLQVANQDSVELFLSAADDSSGLAEMQVSLTPGFEGATWEPYSAIVPVTFAEDGEHTVYVRVRDSSGNTSDASSDSLVVDTTPPIGGASVLEGVVGSDAIWVTVALGAEDDATGVGEARISTLESFTDTIWQPYASQVAVPISYTGELEPVLYAQFRDGAGNASQVYSTTYLVDTAPPVLYVEVEPGSTLTRTVTVLAYDELVSLGQMWVSNDPLMLDEVLSMPYTSTVTWTFDERRVVWVQLADSVGNVSEPYPAYAGEWKFAYLPMIVRD